MTIIPICTASILKMTAFSHIASYSSRILGSGKGQSTVKNRCNIITVFERPSNKRKISSPESAAKKRRTAVEKRKRFMI